MSDEHLHEPGEECAVCSGLTIQGVYEKVVDDVQREGWAGIGVFPTENDPPGAPSFEYTVGLPEKHGHPELLVFNLSPAVSHGVLQSAVNLITDGQRFEANQRYGGVLAQDYEIEVRPVPRDQDVAPPSLARMYAGGEEIEVLQLVWPDADGRFPGEDGYDQEEFPQPVLSP